MNIDGLDVTFEEAQKNVFANAVEAEAFGWRDIFRQVSVGGWDGLDIGLDTEVRPTGHNGRAQEEAAVGRRVGDMAGLSRDRVRADIGGADAPDAEGTVKEALQPVEVDMEKAQRAGRECFFTRHQVVKRDMLEREKVREPLHDHIGKRRLSYCAV